MKTLSRCIVTGQHTHTQLSSTLPLPSGTQHLRLTHEPAHAVTTPRPSRREDPDMLDDGSPSHEARDQTPPILGKGGDALQVVVWA